MGELVDIKLEPEDPVDYPLPEEDVVATPLDIDIPTDSQRVNQFCRLCLRELPTLFPLASRVQNVMIPEMIAAVTGININMRDNLPKKVCIKCLVKLDYAYHIRQEYVENNKTLKILSKSKIIKLWECLTDYQRGVRAKTETRSEKLLRENKDIIRMRLIRKEEQLSKMTGEELANVDLPKTIPAGNTKESSEVIVDLEPTETLKENIEQEKQTSNTMESSEVWEIESEEEEGSNDRTETNEKETAEKSIPEGYRRILNFLVEVKETDVDPNKCYICQEQFADVTDLELHFPTHREMVPYSCKECKGTVIDPISISTVIMLHRHVKMHAGTTKCPECPYRCFQSASMYNHLKRYHLQDPNADCTCKTCGAKVKNKKSLENHMRMHKAVEEGRFTCSFCAKKFATSARLVRHERIHTNERPFACRYCSKGFTNKTSFQAHERSHTGVRGYRCEECGKSHRTRTELNMHLSTTHKIMKRPNDTNKEKYVTSETSLKCTVEGCDFETKNRSKYYQHKAGHTLNFHCPYCELRFPTKQRLESHEFVHTKLKRFCCELCGKSFRFRNSFVDHMANHNNIRAHTCGVCNLSFVRERNLKEHMKKHSDTLDYACRHCGKKFRYRADLSKHERTHPTETTLTKEEVDLVCSDDMDLIAEECDEEGILVEYLDDEKQLVE